MIACYIRVSTTGQNSQSQRREIERWLKANRYQKTDVQWFEDKKSGDTLLRPGFEALQKAVFMGEVKTIVVWRLDRLSRKLHDGINTLAGWCDKGVRVVSITQQLDLTGTVGRMIASVLFGVAEMEQEARRERQAVGIAAAKAKGVYKANGERRTGYRKASRELVTQMLTNGHSPSYIAENLGIARSTVYNYRTESKQN